jgi:hypothetical protein
MRINLTFFYGYYQFVYDTRDLSDYRRSDHLIFLSNIHKIPERLI